MNARRFKKEYIIIAVAAIVKLILQLISLSNSGYFSDELLHIETGKHLAVGYRDFPPMIGMLAWLQNLFHSDSIFVNHLFNLILSILIVIFCGLTTIKLGGRWLAVLTVLLCILLSPGMGASQILFIPTAFEQLFWIICIYYIASYCNVHHHKYLILFCIFAALGFLTKYSMVFLLGGVLISVALFQKSLFSNKVFWIGLLIFLILISANLFWQIKNQFRVFEHFSQLYETQLNDLSRVDEVKRMILFLNPLTLILWFTGLFIIPFASKYKAYRLLSFALLFSFILLFIAKGKWYYYFPIILGLIPLGTVFFEQLLQKRKWIIYTYLAALCITGAILLPHGIPILKLDRYITLYNLKPNEDNKIPLFFDNYYSVDIWDQLLGVVKKTYTSLPAAEQEKCLVWGRHYSHAGGINLLGEKYGLPQAFSLHSSFEWLPELDKDAVIIAVGESNWVKRSWEEYFEEVEEVGVVENPYAPKLIEYCYRIYLCKKLKYSSAELKEICKD